MLPKAQAAVERVASMSGRRALITMLEKAGLLWVVRGVIKRNAGTVICA